MRLSFPPVHCIAGEKDHPQHGKENAASLRFLVCFKGSSFLNGTSLMWEHRKTLVEVHYVVLFCIKPMELIITF